MRSQPYHINDFFQHQKHGRNNDLLSDVLGNKLGHLADSFHNLPQGKVANVLIPISLVGAVAVSLRSLLVLARTMLQGKTDGVEEILFDPDTAAAPQTVENQCACVWHTRT